MVYSIKTGGKPRAATNRDAVGRAAAAGWPLQDIVLLQSFIVRVNHPFTPPHLQSLPYYNTIVRPFRNIRPPTDPPFVCHAPYTIGDGTII